MGNLWNTIGLSGQNGIGMKNLFSMITYRMTIQRLTILFADSLKTSLFKGKMIRR
jgi:hypothetical protein